MPARCSINWANDVGKSQGQVKASLGLTAEEANKLTDAAINVWERGFGDSIDSVNQVIVSVRQNMGDLAGNELESVATGAITISDIFRGRCKRSNRSRRRPNEEFRD